MNNFVCSVKFTPPATHELRMNERMIELGLHQQDADQNKGIIATD